MKFAITSAGNNSTCGDLFFSVPTQLGQANVEVIQLCCRRCKALYGNGSFAAKRLADEIGLMIDTETAFLFLLLKEVADLSREAGYPVLIPGSAAGSIISFLLGITTINPLKAHYRCESPQCQPYFEEDEFCGMGQIGRKCPHCGKEMKRDGFDLPFHLVWRSEHSPQAPDFSVMIAAPVRPLLHSRLDTRFGFTGSNESLFKRISLVDNPLCERIGRLAKQTGVLPDFEQFDQEVLQRTLCNLAEKEAAELDEWRENDWITEEAYQRSAPFLKDLKAVAPADFYELTKIFGYVHGTFLDAKTLEHLEKDFDCYFTLADDFYLTLRLEFGMPDDLAAEFTREGIWSHMEGSSHTEKREKYDQLLEEYQSRMSQQDLLMDLNKAARKEGLRNAIKEYFQCVSHLWTAASCISRLQLLCAEAWYQLHYPETVAAL